MRLGLRRRPPVSDHSSTWTGRLAAVGHALDALQAPVRDVAVALAGRDAWVSALVWRAGRYHSAWARVDLRLSLPDEATAAAVVPAGPWADRLREVGGCLDGHDAPIADPFLVALDGGWAVTALAGERKALASWEIALA